jgi:myo-inositol 2-dehydrogenase/D-chiro-inositol 1-dehydrogenase
MLGIGIIGVGNMGSKHARIINDYIPKAKVVAVMDKSETCINSVLKFLDNPKVFNDPNQLVDDDTVEAVLIASPDSTHANYAEYTIKKRKFLMLEKPLGLNLDDAEKVLKAEVNYGKRIVQVGLMREFDNQHSEIKNAINENVIGRPLLFRGIHKHLVQAGRSPADVITNSAVHDIHSARWLMDDDITEVFADQIDFRDSTDNTTRLVLLQLRFKNGGLGTIEVDIDNNYGYEVFVEISGEKGTLKTPSIVSPILRKGNSISQKISKDWLLRFDQAYKQEIFSWVKATLEHKVVGASIWDAYMAMHVAEMAIKSLSSRKAEKISFLKKPNIY